MLDNFLNDCLKAEQARQGDVKELIASENFVSLEVRNLMGSIFTNKYAEGYPNEESIKAFREEFPNYKHMGKVGRYYGGCFNVDMVELYCRYLWQKVFGVVGEYHVNVQPHSGTQANMAAYDAILKPGDTILAMSLDHGGHLSHSSSVSFVGKKYNVITYGVTENNELDYIDIYNKIKKEHPKLIITGASAFSGHIDFRRIKAYMNEIAVNSSYSPYLLADISHVAGLVACGLYDDPFYYADIVTTTTHKTLRGPRGGLIFCKPELANVIDQSVFPRNQGGPLMHIIAAKAQAASEALQPSYKEYIEQIIKNAESMCDAFKGLGVKIVGNGTTNHLFIIDVLSSFGISGKEAQKLLEANGYTVNKNALPNDTLPPAQASGIRIGVPAETTKGMTEFDFRAMATDIYNILKNKD